MLDFIIVGNGLAANVLALNFYKQQISYQIVGDSSLSNCSGIAAGIWNPIVFKRMTKSWKIDELLPTLKEFYQDSETLLNTKFYTERKILKPFYSQEEINFWLKKSEGDLKTYVSNTLLETEGSLKHLILDNHYSYVNQCGNIQMNSFLSAASNFHLTNGNFLSQKFDYTKLEVKPGNVSYGELEAKNIIFCEGYLVKDNPYFQWIPLKPVKGEVLEIKTEDLNLGNSIFNRDGFIFKQNNETYKLGATYNWESLNDSPTDEGLLELQTKASKMIRSNYEVVNHSAGVRPSSIDRRPIIGAHPKHDNLFVFNGLGTKGVMLAPYFAKNFVNFYQKKEVLNSEINIARFYTKYFI